MQARLRARSCYHGGLLPMDEFEESIKLRNLYKALRKCCAGSMWKDGTAMYRSDGLENSVKLRADLKAGTYKLQRYMRFKITRPKPREIMATRIRDRHGQRSACDNVLYPALTHSFIHDNGACQKDKGVDYAIERAKCWMRRIYRRQRQERADAAGCRVEDVGPFQAEGWVYKGDVKKYFPSSGHVVAKETLRKALKSPKLLAVFCAVVESFGEDYWAARAMEAGAAEADARRAAKGITDARKERAYIPIRPENRREVIGEKCEQQIRQSVANLRGLTPASRARLLDEARNGDARGIGLGSQMSQLIQLAQLDAIDHYAKEVRHVPMYIRYMDDYIMIDADRERLTETAREIEAMLHALGLELNPKSQLLPLKHGFIFLRFHFYLTPTGKVIMKAAPGVAQNEKRRLKRMVARARAGLATIDSVRRHYEGWRAHIERGNTRELLRSMDKYLADLLAKTDGQEREENQ